MEEKSIMKRARGWVIGLCVLSLFVAGCVTRNIVMTPKTKATMILAAYNTQAEQIVAMSKRTDLTEEQKGMVRKKKAIIERLDPLIKTFGLTVQSGGTPSVEDEQAIYDLIDDLVLLGG
jgi:hypothetical protein